MSEYSNNNLPEITLKYKAGNTKKTILTGSETTSNLLRSLYDSDTLEINENVIVLFLNRANKTLGWTKHSSGGACSCIMDVKLILTTALQCGAQAMILSHNHPSGNLKPSQQDLAITARINTACKALDLTLLDHVIITTEGYYSFADEGQM